MSPQDDRTVKKDKSTMFVYFNFLVLQSTTICSQNINKQNVNIAYETLTDYNFLSRYHYTKSKNYVKRRYRIRHWIHMFIGTPCKINYFYNLTCTIPKRVSTATWCFVLLLCPDMYWCARYLNFYIVLSTRGQSYCQFSSLYSFSTIFLNY